MPATDGIWRRDRLGSVPAGATLRWISLASVALAVAATAVLLVRRLSGALAEPLPAVPLVATAIVALAWAGAVWLLLPSAERWLSRWLPAMVLVLLAVACSYPGARVIDSVVWLPTLTAIWLLPGAASYPARHGSPAIARAAAATHEDQHVLQQLTRFRTAEGIEGIRGTLTAEFAPGERTVALHAAFCPPLERLPQVEVEVNDATATVKVAQVLHNGVRLDVRLARPTATKRDVGVELSAMEIRE